MIKSSSEKYKVDLTCKNQSMKWSCPKNENKQGIHSYLLNQLSSDKIYKAIQ